MNPRLTWKLGAILAGLGLVVSLVMLVVEGGPNEPRAQPWKQGLIGFGGVALISIAGLLLTKQRE